MPDDGSTKPVAAAKVASYSIKEPTANEDFQLKTD
jgi:hypothetical protein